MSQVLQAAERISNSSRLAANQMCCPRFDSATKSRKESLSLTCREISPMIASRTP